MLPQSVVPSYSIGVDLGGTNLRVAAIGEDGSMLEKVAEPISYDNGPEAVIATITDVIRAVTSRIENRSLCGVGIGVPGFINMETGTIIGSANLPGFEEFPVRDAIQRHLGTSIILENDANAAALGELWMGAGKNVKDLVLLTLGTGIGGGIVVDGKVLHGFLGMAGEFGHMTVFPDGNPCGCGNRGCLEKHASATAVTAMARLMQLGEDLPAKDVYEIALGDGPRAAKAREIWRIVGESLGIALATLINTFNFPLYLLSGGLLGAWELFAPEMMHTVERRSFTYRATKTETRIAMAALGNEAGLYGAAYLPWNPSEPQS